MFFKYMHIIINNTGNDNNKKRLVIDIQILLNHSDE